MTSFKIYFSETNIRRLRIEKETPAYNDVTNMLHSLYPQDYHPELFLKWQDEDGDKITVSSQQEWTHLLNAVKERPIKLYVSEGLAPYFKDGPPAEPQYFYADKEEEVPKESSFIMERLNQSIPECLQHLFPGNRILPYDIPEWLQNAVSLKRLPLPGNVVDLDVDIPKLFEAMHKRALSLLNETQNFPLIQQAKSLLIDMLSLIPKHAITLYNLSCAESLLGNKKNAIDILKSAIQDGGYSNVEHMMSDPDLTNIRDEPEFKNLVASLQPQEKMEEEDEVVPILVPVAVPILSVGEQKWSDAISQLKGMGFGQDEQYFGIKCVVSLEKHKGDLSAVISEFLA